MYSIPLFELVILSSAAIAFGLILLIKGGDWTVDASVAIAQKLNISPKVIGFTIIAFGTSLPELLVTVNANMSGFPGLAAGGVIGSNISNVLLVLGTSAVIYPLVFKDNSILHDMIVMLASSAILVALVYQGGIERWQGMAMFSLLVLYVLFKFYYKDVSEPEELLTPEEHSDIGNVILASGILVTGLIAVSLGSEFLVRGAVKLAEIAAIPESLIGLSLVAIGTSLPEMSVGIQAARRKENGIIIGNVVGSNVFNILSILGMTATIKRLPFDTVEILPDVWFMMGTMILLTALAYGIKKTGRSGGVFMLLIYVGFITYRYLSY